jgi:hypothetical protein
VFRETMSNSNTMSSQKEGIDVRLALEILSERQSSSSSSSLQQSGDCDCHRNVPPQATSMGQVIDLDGPSTSTSTSTAAVTTERKERKEEIETKLLSMTEKDLLHTVLKAQEERVATYQRYDRGLETVVQTRNVSDYPQTCVEATASFSVLSETIRAVDRILEERKHSYSKLVQTLQQHEKSKLELTAALHLERIRLVQEEDGKLRDLLHHGVKLLQDKLAVCRQDINEAIDEIRCEYHELS